MTNVRLKYLIPLVLLGGCDGKVAPKLLPVPDAAPPADETAPSGLNYSVLTMVDDTKVDPGSTVTVRCFLKQGTSTFFPTMAMTVSVSPAQAVSMQGAVGTFVPTQTGAYVVSCRSADGAYVDADGVSITVGTTLPSTWTVAWNASECFGASDVLLIDARVFDTYGTDVSADAAFDVSIVPPEGVTGSLQSGFRFASDGNYEVTVAMAGPIDDGGDIEPQSFSVRVDATPPVIAITSPLRNAMQTEGTLEDSSVLVSGVVNDVMSALTTLRVNGIDIAVAGMQEAAFELDAAARWGLSIVAARAEDACGNVGYLAQPFLRSPAYYPAATSATTSARVNEAIVVQFSQSIVDDGDRSDLDDLVSLMQAALDNTDFNSKIPPGTVLSQKAAASPGVFSPTVGYVAKRHPSANQQISLATQIDHMTFVGGGIDAELGAANAAFPLRLQVTVRQWPTTVDTFTVDAVVGFDKLTARGLLAADLYEGQVLAALPAIDLAIEGLFIDLDCGSFDWACNDISGLVVAAVEDNVAAMLEATLQDMLPEQLGSTLGSISLAKTMRLPCPLGTRLDVEADLTRLTLCGPDAGIATPASCLPLNTTPGSVGFGLGVQVYPQARGSSIPAEALGAIKFGAGTGAFDSAQTSFGVGISLDVINQALWSMWYSGALDFPNLTKVLGGTAPASLSGMQASASVGLPPVLMPGRDGNVVELGLADMNVNVTTDVAGLLGDGAEPTVVSANMTVSVIIGAQISFDTDKSQMQLIVGNNAQIAIEITDINNLAYGQMLGEQMSGLMSEGIAELINENLQAIPLPRVNLGGVMGIPSDTVWKLDAVSLSHQNGYVVLAGVVGVTDDTAGAIALGRSDLAPESDDAALNCE